MNFATPSANYFEKELQEFKDALATTGIHGALYYLNKRTPHRFTGIYRYDGDMLRNVALFDKYEPEVRIGADAAMSTTYCSLLQKRKALEILNATEDTRVKGRIFTDVASYCGVSMVDKDGKPFGSLCHFDMKRCQERITDFPLLESASKILYEYIILQHKHVQLI